MPEGGLSSTLCMVFLLALGTFLYLNDLFKAEAWMPASAVMVFKHHEYWRLWTALFAHADLAHILGNLFLFVPFAYFLSHYFSLWLFPLIGFLLGGLINFIVIKSMPESATIIGVSGVVYWMGATWMTLAFFIDRRETLTERFLKVTGVSIVLFFPTTFLPEVSYLSHFLGYIFGIFTGALVYFLFRKRFQQAEVIEVINEDETFFDWENFSIDKIFFKPLTEKDVPMVREWLSREHIFKNKIASYEERNKSENVNSYIVYFKELPIGFVQSYEAPHYAHYAHPDQHAHHAHQAVGTYGIDGFIAEKKLLGKGIGSTFIKKFSDELLNKEEVDALVTELAVFNAPAIKAYKKAGFKRVENLHTSNGSFVLMIKKR